MIKAEDLRTGDFVRVSHKCSIPEPPQAPQPNSTFDYAQMTRQQRRAYERRLAKENNRKH